MENEKQVNFEKYCATCKHDKGGLMNSKIGIFDGFHWTGAKTKEEYFPCCDCLETSAREGTEVPIKWEVK